MLAILDCSQPSYIHITACELQMGTLISQQAKPIVFRSKNLNSAQPQAPTTEKEVLSIVAVGTYFKLYYKVNN